MPATFTIVSVSKHGEESDTKFGYTAKHKSEIVNAVAKYLQVQIVSFYELDFAK
jgi:hypothetical protein